MPVKYNEYIKRPEEEIEFTPERIKELVKCKDDIEYFFSNYVYIVNEDEGLTLFKPRDFQRDLLEKFFNYRFNVGLVARQSGKSVCVGGYALHFACFNSFKTIGIASNKEDSAKDVLSRVKLMYENLPNWLKPGVEKWDETSIVFENGTKIIVSATSKDAFRGKSISLLILDELAFVDPQWKAEQFWTANYPTISSSSTAKIIVISTPNGLHNLFHRIYSKAEKGENEFIPTFYDWTAIPGRDENWKKLQIENLGSEVLFNQEFGCQFIGSSYTVISAETLRYLLDQKQKPDPLLKELGGSFRIYEKPQSGYTYILGVDTAKGSGEHFSTVQVLRLDSVNPVKLKQVAVFEDNKTDVYHFSEIVFRISNYYNNGYIMCENNAEGSTVVSQLWWEYEAEQLVNSGSKSVDLGVRAKKNTKPKAVNLMKKFIEDGLLELEDQKTIQQLSDFTDLGNNKFKCVNLNDDLISALYWSVYIFEMEVLDEDLSFKKEEEVEDDVWGILSDFGESEESDWSWVVQ